MRIHTNGNVGIGEAAPTAKLHIMQDTQNTNGLLIEEDTDIDPAVDVGIKPTEDKEEF